MSITIFLEQDFAQSNFTSCHFSVPIPYYYLWLSLIKVDVAADAGGKNIDFVNVK